MDDLSAAAARVPTIFDWVGGRTVFRRWFETFYDLVEADDLLSPVFGGTVSLEHRERATNWWCEVMGGPPTYTDVHGGYAHMLARHRGLGIDGETRLRFVTLLSRAADLAGVPADPECRAALMGYAEWGTRLAVENSALDGTPTQHAPVPRWGWGVAPPYLG